MTECVRAPLVRKKGSVITHCVQGNYTYCGMRVKGVGLLRRWEELRPEQAQRMCKRCEKAAEQP